jgi:hypothetical protein
VTRWPRRRRACRRAPDIVHQDRKKKATGNPSPSFFDTDAQVASICRRLLLLAVVRQPAWPPRRRTAGSGCLEGGAGSGMVRRHRGGREGTDGHEQQYEYSKQRLLHHVHSL